MHRWSPVGAVLLAADGTIVAEGRNRVCDPPGGHDRLQGNLIAHAEMNVLAAVDTGTELDDLTLWSSHRPCEMCAAAQGSPPGRIPALRDDAAGRAGVPTIHHAAVTRRSHGILMI